MCLLTNKPCLKLETCFEIENDPEQLWASDSVSHCEAESFLF